MSRIGMPFALVTGRGGDLRTAERGREAVIVWKC